MKANILLRIAALGLSILLLYSCKSAKEQFTVQEKSPLEDDLSFRCTLQSVSEENIFRSEDYFNWCSSILKGEDGLYHMFYSRWKREYGFYAWLTHSEVAHAVSASPTGPWEYKETAIRGRGGSGWDAITAHNPKIKYFEGRYYLYYVGTHMGGRPYTNEELIETARVGYSHPNWQILRPNQRTGVAVSSSLYGPWQRVDEPIIEPSGPITTLTVNPAIDRGGDGKYYLIVKGDKPNETRFIRNQAIAISDTPHGPFVMQEKAVIDDLDTEDMSMWYNSKRNRFYGVYHAHTFIGLITSGTGTDWEPASEDTLMLKSIRLEDGGVIEPDRMERPFVYVEDENPVVLSLAVKKEDDSFIVIIPVDGQ